jgi:hypothetical protein
MMGVCERGLFAQRPVPPRRIQPNHGILGSMLRHNIRTNDRMDKEEVERATAKVIRGRNCLCLSWRAC